VFFSKISRQKQFLFATFHFGKPSVNFVLSSKNKQWEQISSKRQKKMALPLQQLQNLQK
jgi:hypothetical protein